MFSLNPATANPYLRAPTLSSSPLNPKPKPKTTKVGLLTRLLRPCNHDLEPPYYDSDGEEIYAPRPIRKIPVNETVSRKQTGPMKRVGTIGKDVRRDERVWWKEQCQPERLGERSTF